MTLTFRQRMIHRLMRLMVRFMPSCRDISALVSKELDERLPWRQRLNLRLHLSMCALCRRYEQQLHLIRRGARQGGAPGTTPPGEGLSAEARERLRHALDSRT